MAKVIPFLATIGLVCLMILPAPGVWGLRIGLGCVIAIAACAILWSLDRIASRLALALALARRRRTRRRGHAEPATMHLSKAMKPKVPVTGTRGRAPPRAPGRARPSRMR